MANIDTASRLSCVTGCAKRFEFQYVHKLPQKDGGALILGNTVHDGLQMWFEARRATADPPSLWSCMQEAWEQHIPDQLWRRVKPEIELLPELEKIAGAIKTMRPSLVKPRETKEFKETDEAQRAAALAERTRSWLEANQTQIRWNNSEPPVKTYQVAKQIAERLEVDWAPLPVPYLVERPFEFEYDGYPWHGRLDVYGPLSPEGELIPTLIDWKTGQAPSVMELFIQACIYHMAITRMELPIEVVEFHIVRQPYSEGKNPIQIHIDPDKHYKVLTRMRRSQELIVNEHGMYEPSYSFACRNCDWSAMCASELNVNGNEA